MTYEERLQNVSVLGAAGKMGSGILLLTAVEMADHSLKPENKGKLFILNAIDASNEQISGVRHYLEAQVRKIAEKKAVHLRKVYESRPDLVENGEIIEQYVSDVLNLVRPTTRIEAAYDSTIIFEAIKEDPALKVSVLSQIDSHNPGRPWYFTNTSSIPILKLDEGAGLGGRIIGFHFYNPPPVQKLVELIKSGNTIPDLADFALTYAKNLRKTVVPARDVAGFIGNGHFMREILYAEKTLDTLQKDLTFAESVYALNRISQEYLVRPMGIFQLIDYVGIDVCRYILAVMNSYAVREGLHSPLLDRYLALGVKGGQYSDGSQKDGFLKYEKGKLVAVYDPEMKEYIPFPGIAPRTGQLLGFREGLPPWKSVVGLRDKDTLLKEHFDILKSDNSKSSEYALAYARNSKNIGRKLVEDGVAFEEKDVNTVMLTGFYHAYGPINNYVD